MDTKTILNNIEIEALLSSLLDTKINNIFITGLYSSAKSFAISSVVENGLHFIILNNKEDASVCINDLYNIKDEEKIFFFPSSENKNLRSSIKDASLKVQRTAAISAIKEFISEAPRLVLANPLKSHNQLFQTYVDVWYTALSSTKSLATL